MKKKKLILLSLAVFSIALGCIFLFSNENLQAPLSNSTAVTEPSSPMPVINKSTFPAEQELQKLNAEIQALKKKLDVPMEFGSENVPDLAKLQQELQANEQASVIISWVADSHSPISHTIELDERITVKEPVSFDADKAASVIPGDVVSLPLPGANEYKAKVEHVQLGDDGETTWSGHLQGYQDDYPVTFTIGSQKSYATVATPEGGYAMEADNGKGFVYKTPDQDDLIDPHQNDEIVIPENPMEAQNYE